MSEIKKMEGELKLYKPDGVMAVQFSGSRAEKMATSADVAEYAKELIGTVLKTPEAYEANEKLMAMQKKLDAANAEIEKLKAPKK